nr:MAG TPA: hypothetical protein [Caudoviricetes sp.]
MCYQKCYHDKEKNVNSQRNDVLFTWWRRWESNPCPKRAQCRCLRVQAIYNIPAAPRRSSG